MWKKIKGVPEELCPYNLRAGEGHSSLRALQEISSVGTSIISLRMSMCTGLLKEELLRMK